jgi:hypothetical protein
MSYTQFGYKWSTPTPNSTLVISSLVFQGFCFLVDGISVCLVVDSLSLTVTATGNHFCNFVLLCLGSHTLNISSRRHLGCDAV